MAEVNQSNDFSMLEQIFAAMSNSLCCILNILKGSAQLNTLYQNASNPVSVPIAPTAPVLVLTANPDRKQLVIVAYDTQAIQVQYGAPGQVVHILAGAVATGDGSGGDLSDEVWKGNVYLQAVGSTGQAVVSELI